MPEGAPWGDCAVNGAEVVVQPLPLGTADGVVDVGRQEDAVDRALVCAVVEEGAIAGSGRVLHQQCHHSATVQTNFASL